MTPVFASNLFLSRDIRLIAAALTNDGWLQLFKNDVIPSPASIQSDFIRCDFPGYSPVALSSIIGLPVRERDGVYAIPFDLAEFTCTAASSQLAFGWWIQFGETVWYSSRFDTPLPLVAPITLSFTPQVRVRSIDL